jgi:hypothetical protein
MESAAPPPCPYLPVPERVLTAACLEKHGPARGPYFYLTALLYAQSLWLQGLPARALLLLNRALGCDLTGTEPVLAQWPLPYRAVVWILHHHRPDQFLGNPRRHWQHLATRMSGPRSELRTWRAWACWRLACLALPDLPADDEQIAREGVREPAEEEIAAHLERAGLPWELLEWRAALVEAASGR